MALRLDFTHNSALKMSTQRQSYVPIQSPQSPEPDQLREIKITRHYTKHAEGSVLVEFGDTKVCAPPP